MNGPQSPRCGCTHIESSAVVSDKSHTTTRRRSRKESCNVRWAFEMRIWVRIPLGALAPLLGGGLAHLLYRLRDLLLQ